jgi:hypothetical protein
MHHYIQGTVYTDHLLHGACIYIPFCTVACCDIQPARDQEKNGIFGVLLGNYGKKKLNLLHSTRDRPRNELNL